MADVKKLTKFHIEEAGNGFSLHIEDESGGHAGTERERANRST